MPDSYQGAPPPAGLEQLVGEDVLQSQYGTTGEQIKAGVEGIGEGILGPIAPMIEKAVGVDEKDIRGRAKANPVTSGLGKGAGFLASAALGTGVAPVLGAVGKAGAAAAGLGELAGASTLTKIGASALTNAIEGAGFAASDELSKMVLHDPDQTANTALVGVGLGTLFGGVVGAGIGSISPLWKAASETQVGGILKSVTEHLSGAEPAAMKSPVMQAVDEIGLNLAPELKAALSDDPILNRIAKTLEQSDTTGAGVAFQKVHTQLKTDIAARAEEIIAPYGNRLEELSHAEAGKKIGTTLADEIASRVSPLSRDFNQIKTNFADTKLPYFTTSELAEDVSKLANEQGWMVSPSSDIAQQVNTILKELPNLKNLKDLSGYIEAVGNATSKDPLNGTLRRQGGMLKDIFRQYESKVIETELGDVAPDLLGRFRDAQKLYSREAKLKDALDSRLHLRGSVSGYAERVREMATTDSETLLRRLSGKGDADLLNVLAETYPKTAEELRKHIVDTVMDKAISKAKPGEALNTGSLVKAIEGMEPELRSFALPEIATKKVEAMGQILEKLAEQPHNFSNTARTMDKLMSYVPGSAIGLATMAMGHNPALGFLLGSLTKTIGKDAPDAMRLSLLKFLGSDVPVSGSGFKAAFDYIRSVAKGDKLMQRAAEAVFKGGEVIPEKIIPDAAKREALDKMVKVSENDPQKAIDSSGEVGHYMPDQATGIGITGARAMSYLASIKPRDERTNPLDSPKPINTTKQAAYNRALDIAEQPLIILKSVADGSVTSRDVQALIAMYPGFVQQIQTRLTSEMVGHLSKGETVPYKARLGLSVLAQQALDGTMTAQGILAAQPPPEQPQQGTQKGPKASPEKLNKVDTLAMTTNQASQARKAGVQS